MPGSMIGSLSRAAAANIGISVKIQPANSAASTPLTIENNTIVDPRILAEIQRQASLRNNFSQSEGH